MVESINTESNRLDAEILKALHQNGSIPDSLIFAKAHGVSHTDLDKSLKSLLVDDYLALEVKESKSLELSEEGALYATKGTPEF